MAFSHGTQDAQKTVGVIALGLIVRGHLQGFSIALWMILVSATALGLGTVSGGWRVMRSLGNRITRLDSQRAFGSSSPPKGGGHF
jgi:inorganic phosphate transporter, PiT family